MENIVLLVDDDDNLLNGVARALRKQPYQIYTAKSGDEAMWTLKTHHVDVIVVDEQMPGMSGSDLLAWVASNYPEVMRIALTGCATTETVIRAINESAVYHFFTKPCDEVRLAITIRKALEHKELLKENHRLTEQSKHQVRELEHFSQDLDILTRIVSQDLRQPLRTISQSCQSLEEQYSDVFDPKAKALIDNALDATAEVQRCVAKLLEHTRTGGYLSPSNGCHSDESKVTPTTLSQD